MTDLCVEVRADSPAPAASQLALPPLRDRDHHADFSERPFRVSSKESTVINPLRYPVMVYQGAVFYTLVVVGALTLLTALPGVIRPYTHMSVFMSESLPDASDTKTNAQLTLFWWMAQKANVMLGIFIIASAYTCPCLPIVGFTAFIFIVRASVGLRLMYGGPAQYMGVSTKNVMPLLVLTVVFVSACIAAIFLGLNDPDYMADAAAMEEAAPAKIEEYGALVYWLAGVSGFFVLANVPAIFMPSMALESYFVPGNLTEEKYASTKFVEIMRMCAVGWTLLSFGQLAGIMMAPDLSVYGPMIVIFNLVFTGLFIYNISNAGMYGFDVRPALFFLFLVSSSTGAAAMGLLLI